MLNAIPIKIAIGYQGTFSKRGSYWGAEETLSLSKCLFFFWKYCPV